VDSSNRQTVSQRCMDQKTEKASCLVAAIALFLLGVPAAQGAQPEKDAPKKPAWKWTLDERLAARLDPESMAARVAENRARTEAILKSQGVNYVPKEQAGPPLLEETIIGSKNPELFLPSELFDALLGQAFLVADRQAGRNWIEPRAAALGFGRDFLDRLGKTVEPYLRLLTKQGPRGQRITISEEEDLRLCHLRVQALEATEAEFGEESFLRLLYEAVAPSLQRGSMFGPGPPDYQRYEEKLRFEEGGCH
jgi:hypothetical protein